MATGPEHYQAAEQLLHIIKRGTDRARVERLSADDIACHIGAATVHAQLALAAATAMAGRIINISYPNGYVTGVSMSDMQAWDTAAGEPT